MGEMTIGDERSAGEFRQQSVHRSHMKAGNNFFQLWEKNIYQTCHGRFEFCPFLNLVKTITG